MPFDHEKLDVYRRSLEFVALSASLLDGLDGQNRHVRDQLLRSSQSITLNIAEGNGKRSYRDRKRYLEIARGSAMESAAALDILVYLGARSESDIAPGRQLLLRIVTMLSKMTQVIEGRAREDAADYDAIDGDEFEHDYEHEHEHG